MFSRIIKKQLKKGGCFTGNISQSKREKKKLRAELEEYKAKGISLYLNGEPKTPKHIAKACKVAEGGVYMRDYTEDEMGRIARVDFDFVRL